MNVICDCACGSVYVGEDGLGWFVRVKEQNVIPFLMFLENISVFWETETLFESRKSYVSTITLQNTL